jgi:carbamoyltransferase
MKRIMACPEELFSLGNLWTKLTRFVFKLSAGYPRGCQAGSVMAMAALGDSEKFYEDILKMCKEDFQHIRITPPGMVRGRALRDDEEEVFHPYLNKFRKIAEEDDQDKFNLAASLQRVTEEVLFDILDQAVAISSKNGFVTKNLCLVGGVSLNSVATGKISKNLSRWGFEKVYIPPVPYDGGLNIGACQYHWHSVLGNPRHNQFVSPYLGEEYCESNINDALNEKDDEINVRNNFSLKDCAKLLVEGKIVSIFQGRSESGRRALGNRSILANPMIKDMKDLINQKVKHRQWYRPFAPSALEEYCDEWFEDFFPSPYMSFVFDIKPEKRGIAPAIEHFDGTARLQSVSKTQNETYHNLIQEFHKLTGVPIVLNTSFNDREPICETAVHALDCFLRTEIDHLYFPEYEVLVSRKN